MYVFDCIVSVLFHLAVYAFVYVRQSAATSFLVLFLKTMYIALRLSGMQRRDSNERFRFVSLTLYGFALVYWHMVLCARTLPGGAQSDNGSGSENWFDFVNTICFFVLMLSSLYSVYEVRSGNFYYYLKRFPTVVIMARICAFLLLLRTPFLIYYKRADEYSSAVRDLDCDYALFFFVVRDSIYWLLSWLLHNEHNGYFENISHMEHCHVASLAPLFIFASYYQIFMFFIAQFLLHAFYTVHLAAINVSEGGNGHEKIIVGDCDDNGDDDASENLTTI